MNYGQEGTRKSFIIATEGELRTFSYAGVVNSSTFGVGDGKFAHLWNKLLGVLAPGIG